MAEEQALNDLTEEVIIDEPQEEIIEENIPENNPEADIEVGSITENPESETVEATKIEAEVNPEIQETAKSKQTQKKKVKRPKKKRRSIFSSLSPFEITMIVLGVLIAIVLIAGFWYLYESALKSRKAIPKSGIVTSDEDKSWMTRIVNSSSPLGQEFAVATSAVTGAPGIQVDSRVTKETVQMLEDLKSHVADSGEDVNILAGYSSVVAYLNMYQAKVKDLMESNNLTYDEAANIVNQSMRLPGTDEHSLGLLINFGIGGTLDNAVFKESQSYDWLKNNAWKYGYIERYPEGKDQVTNHAYDPTAFRYVGKDIAEQIYEQQITLEEYNAAEAQRKAQEEAAKQAEAQAEAQAQAEAEAKDTQAQQQ